MNAFLTRLTRGFAVLIAAIVPATLLGMAPAHAADHFTVDRDNVALGGFSGSIESWHDGANTRATLTGNLPPYSDLKVTFLFSDFRQQTGEATTGGASKNIVATSGLGFTVVAFTVSYTPGDEKCGVGEVDSPDHGCMALEPVTGTWYVGDSPDSLGTCQQLDSDPVSVQRQDYALLYGKVTYGCTSDGHIVAHVRTTLEWESYTTGTSASARVLFTYADGSQQVIYNPTTIGPATRDNPDQQAISENFDTPVGKNIRSVQLFVQRNLADGPSMTSKFGDG